MHLNEVVNLHSALAASALNRLRSRKNTSRKGWRDSELRFASKRAIRASGAGVQGRTGNERRAGLENRTSVRDASPVNRRIPCGALLELGPWIN